jgi:hypothetical protein
MILTVSGKVSDMCGIGLYDTFLNKTVLSHDGYVPEGLGIGGGDYLEFDIDVQTGCILSWKPLTEKQIRGLVNKA